jgi:hypothetical protein
MTRWGELVSFAGFLGLGWIYGKLIAYLSVLSSMRVVSFSFWFFRHHTSYARPSLLFSLL